MQRSRTSADKRKIRRAYEASGGYDEGTIPDSEIYGLDYQAAGSDSR
jgi:hypothetical protein